MQGKEKTFEVEHIVARRVNKGKEEYLVYWKGFDLSSATWEPVDNLLSCTDLLDQFIRQVDPIPGANPINISEFQKNKTVHVKMLLTRKRKYSRGRSSTGDNLIDTNSESPNTISMKANHNMKKKLSESERLIRDTLVHESKTMTPEDASLGEVNGIYGFGQDSPIKVNTTPLRLNTAQRRSRLNQGSGSNPIKIDEGPPSGASYTNGVSHPKNDPYDFAFLPNKFPRSRNANEEGLILCSNDKSFLKITLNNVARHNILTVSMLETLRDCFIKAQKTSSIKAVLLQNNGDYFCSGIDYSELIDCEDDKQYKALAQELCATIHNLMNVLIHFTKPILCAVNGPAYEFGTALVVLSDLAYASSKATFDLVFNKLSLTPIGCLTQLLPKSVGVSMARSMMFLGGCYQAVAAYDRGLILDVYGIHSFEEDINKKMNQLSHQSPQSLEMTKKLLNRFDVERLEQVLNEEMQSYYQCLCSKESRTLIKDNWTVCVHLYDNI